MLQEKEKKSERILQENCFGAASKEKLYPFAFFRMSNLFMSYLHIPKVGASKKKITAFKALGKEEKNLCKSLLIANLFKLG